MDWIEGKDTVRSFLKKYRFAGIVLLAGIFLLAYPQPEQKKEIPVQQHQEEPLQESLERILGEISGAGKVSVLLTQKSGEETIYQLDEHDSGNTQDKTSQKQTVLITGSGREETGLIRQVKAPTYLGAVIVCQGADHADVRLALVEAVRSATGLTADRISVLKMK